MPIPTKNLLTHYGLNVVSIDVLELFAGFLADTNKFGGVDIWGDEIVVMD